MRPCGGTAQDAHACAPAAGGIDSELIYKALKTLMDKGMLGSVMNSIGQDVPYVSESDGNGFVKLVRGNTAKWEPLDTGNPTNLKIFYNELIGADDGSAMNAGFMTIENCDFPWDVACQEIYYVVDGTLTVKGRPDLYRKSGRLSVLPEWCQAHLRIPEQSNCLLRNSLIKKNKEVSEWKL